MEQKEYGNVLLPRTLTRTAAAFVPDCGGLMRSTLVALIVAMPCALAGCGGDEVAAPEPMLGWWEGTRDVVWFDGTRRVDAMLLLIDTPTHGQLCLGGDCSVTSPVDSLTITGSQVRWRSGSWVFSGNRSGNALGGTTYVVDQPSVGGSWSLTRR
jgi:hypothetical protein